MMKSVTNRALQKLRLACVVAIRRHDDSDDYQLYMDRVDGSAYAALFMNGDRMAYVTIPDRNAKDWSVAVNFAKKE